MLLSYEIEFYRQQKVYYSGQTVKGQVNVHVHRNTPVFLEVLAVKLNGKVTCNWFDKEIGKLSETVLNKRINLIANENPTLQPGTVAFTFEHDLPANLPSSFDGVHGIVRYEASVEVKYGDRHENDQKTRFTVIKAFDLNDDDKYTRPIEHQHLQKFYTVCLFGPLCGESEPVQILIRLPVSGYAPDDTINVEMKIINPSNVAIEEVTVFLIKNIAFHMRGDANKSRPEQITLASKAGGYCSCSSSREQFLSIAVPPTQPTDTDSNEICEITYCLSVLGFTDGVRNSIEYDIPITIGSHPLLNRSDTSMPSGSSSAAYSDGDQRRPKGPLQRTLYTPTAPGAGVEGNPPTYEEASKM